MNLLLIIVIVILGGNALIGMKVGMIKTIFSLFSLIVALVLTIWLSPVMKDLIRGNEKIYTGITSKIEKILPFEEERTEVEEQASFIEKLKLPKSIKNSLVENNTSEVYESLSINSFEDYVVNYLAGIFINAAAFIITFAVFIILLWVICFALDLISKLPLLNEVNKTAGLLAGLVHGLVVIWLFFILITVFGSTEMGQKLLQMVDESQILSLVYNNNLLLNFVTSATKVLF